MDAGGKIGGKIGGKVGGMGKGGKGKTGTPSLTFFHSVFIYTANYTIIATVVHLQIFTQFYLY